MIAELCSVSYTSITDLKEMYWDEFVDWYDAFGKVVSRRH